MTVTLNLPPDVEEAFRDEAQAKGVPLENLIQEVLVANRPETDPNRLPYEEWLRRFNAFIDSNADNTVVLPDEAMERESIYGDHGR
ncbi:MAG TPA: hypothetical protein VME43_22005 [Bryobacteraceae bacterium]|nr:hypothetical protein [Bryobacteraceae bacterium]